MIFAIIGTIILVISATGGMLLAGRGTPDRQRQLKIPLFVLYFWLLAFIQLTIAAIVYSLLTG